MAQKKYDRNNEIDFRWEREWRIKGDFKFNLEDVAFGLCPENKLDEYNKLSQGKFPFIDPDWGYKKLMEYLKNEGRKFSKLMEYLKNEGWGEKT